MRKASVLNSENENRRKIKVCHMTDAHQQEDIRIFHKECVSLVSGGYNVYQVSEGKCYESNGVHMVGIGEITGNRLFRMTKAARKVYLVAKSIDADVYHIHDPELLPYALKLKRQGKGVIFDSHEDVPAQILNKYWIPKPMRKLVSNIYKLYETNAVRQLDAVIAATPHIAKKFKRRARKVVVINNYPRLDDIEFHDTSFETRERIVCYAGGIDEIRGEKIMIEAMKDIDGTLIIAGDHKVMETKGVRYVGKLDRKGINELYGQAMVGLCILKPIDNYFYSQPIKMYEYMAAGLPFVCSDFPGWRSVVEASGAGVCVDPEKTKEISDVIRKLIADSHKAQEMGRKGRDYVITHCTWSLEEQNLLSLYEEVRG